MSNKIYGYCRISTNKQSIERQERNILKEYPNAIIIKEQYTGTKVQGRKEFVKLITNVQEGDTIVFDEVSRMSRQAENGSVYYFNLYERGVNLVFIKEPHINTDTYKKALSQALPRTNGAVDHIMIGVENFLKELAKEQIKLAFEQSQKEVNYLHQRTKEGIETARIQGKQIGQVKGAKLTTKKSIAAKEKIIKMSKDFNGTMQDIDIINRLGISRNTYYKYKKEIVSEIEENEE